MTKIVEVPQYILDKANQEDPILKGYINTKIQREPIIYEDKVVGFYSPTKVTYNGKEYDRTGNIYVLPEYQGRGIGTQVINDFFKDKEYGLAHIASNNAASLRAFEKAGFKVVKGFSKLNPKGVPLVLVTKEPVLTPAFLSW